MTSPIPVSSLTSPSSLTASAQSVQEKTALEDLHRSHNGSLGQPDRHVGSERRISGALGLQDSNPNL